MQERRETKVQCLVRNAHSGFHYARAEVNGKLLWKALADGNGDGNQSGARVARFYFKSKAGRYAYAIDSGAAQRREPKSSSE
jgi:hypothetical protein